MGAILAGPTALADRDLVAHVYSHHILESYGNYKRLRDSFTAKAVEAGLADYLTAAFHNRPSIGTIIAARRQKKGEIRNLVNDRKFSQIHIPKDDYDSSHPSSDIFHDAGEVWGGAFWELGGKVGRVRVARLLLQAWERFDPAASTSPASPRPDVQFVRELLETSPPKVQESVKTAFDRRGLNV
jgi:hypothetical protein